MMAKSPGRRRRRRKRKKRRRLRRKDAGRGRKEKKRGILGRGPWGTRSCVSHAARGVRFGIRR